MKVLREISREAALKWAKELFAQKYYNQVLGRKDSVYFTVRFSDPECDQRFVFTAEELIPEEELKVESYYVRLGFTSDIPKPPSDDYKDRLWAAVKLASES